MPKINVSKSIFISAPVDKVFSQINDFNNWSAWSPWIVLDDKTVVNVQPGGKSYSWEGFRIGSGHMEIENEVANKSIDCDLVFIKPWKSKAKTGFIFEENKEGTTVTWTMDSSLPFFMFFMKKMMIAFIGMDYERGLKMLKDKVENGRVNSELTISKSNTFSAKKYIGIKGTCSIADIGLDMSKKIPLIHDCLKKNNLSNENEIVSIYHNWDMINQKTTYTIGAFVDGIPTELNSNFITGEIPKIKVNTITHKGAYEHVGNAWSMQMMMMSRNKEFKQNKKIDPFEIYKNSPYNTPNEELITEVVFPVL